MWDAAESEICKDPLESRSTLPPLNQNHATINFGRPKVQSFCKALRLDALTARQIGDCAGELHHPVIGPRRKGLPKRLAIDERARQIRSGAGQESSVERAIRARIVSAELPD